VALVDRATWRANGVPDYVNMYIYVSDRLATSPPIVLAIHSCMTDVSGFFNSSQKLVAAADANGFVLILPEATGRNCWDVGTAQSLTRDGGGDTQALARMVEYALSGFNGDPERVYVMGGSSGAMMTQAMIAVYPELFRAASARAGVPAGCWADGYEEGRQWSNNCARGTTTQTDAQWGDQARAMYRGYDGPRPRLQIFHGTADTTISYNNQAESIKQWTNVFGLMSESNSTDTITMSGTTYDRELWTDGCGFAVFEAWHARNGSHALTYEEEAISFFGLDQPTDPQTGCQ
jgi:poly(hydroxyalkanoate) depolymerase family esterase